jgi:hypothetical protein
MFPAPGASDEATTVFAINVVACTTPPKRAMPVLNDAVAAFASSTVT